LVTDISPRYGTVEGGDTITFTGTDFSTDTSDYTITIDGVDCPVDTATSTEVTCTSGARIGLVASSLSIYIEDYGYVALQGLMFRYVSLWSSDSTWGGDFAPIEGDSIYIPEGLNLLVDIDETPILEAIVVEGSLTFVPDDDDSSTERFFDARYIFVRGGTMEVGTEDYRYTSKITFTMHGDITNSFLPIYGNKVLGCRFCTLDMHGPVRTPTWTKLAATVEAGGSEITLAEAVDWEVGEEIAVASSSFSGREGEKRTITAIDDSDADAPILTVDTPFDYMHYGEIQYFGDDLDEIDTRAEVGLLSRKVVFKGDDETSEINEYGATIFIHSSGDDSLTARLSYIECTLVGQAAQLGRYAIHFHMIGSVHNSYAKGVAVHKGFNRAFTIHGTHYLRLIQNVAFDVKGHTIFIEDAIECNNYIYNNLIMNTKRSMSLLNTDQTPANFWITSPDNIFVDNAAAGSDRYSFWFDL